MRVLLWAAAVVGIALAFGQCERAPAEDPVTPDDVQLLSEEAATGPHGFGRNGNSGKNGIGHGRDRDRVRG